MHKILVVDDEPKIRELIAKYVRMEGNEAYEAANGFEAVELCGKNEYDLIVMDVMMPELDGFSAVKQIRKKKNTPVIMLTARGEDFDKIHAFESGVDDYVVKPFSPKVLMLRIDAIMRRCQPSAPGTEHEIYKKDTLLIDFTARQVYVDEVERKLAPKEYDLLFFLIRNRNIALPREKILTEVWGYDFYGDDRTLDYHIKMLRKALGENSSSIVTLRGTGYRFDG
ncbi:response regulator transcription factor [Eubacteriales bacterium OttesenSCG-928-K08]|nr:response regulator transcription factor [Eubacteriales bacterium OttesenSCG-928-K08]